VSKIRDGMSKQELLDKHNHVLGLNNINLSIPEQKVQVIMGLSGSGKSTLIRHVNRLIEPTSGELYVDGENVLEMSQSQLREFRRKSTSMVFQKFALLPHKTVSQNVAYGLTIQGVKEKLAKEQSHRWIDRVGLGGFEERYPAQLSGGMQQRVGLARALATDAPILLMDEAFSALDPLIRTDMQNILLELQEELHKTILFITHDLDEALRIGDNIAILRDGKVIQEGDPQEIIMNPADAYIKDFIKDINRSRVVELRSIINKKVKGSGPGLKLNMSVEDALPILNASKTKSFAVVDDKNKILGSVNLNSAIKALSRADESKVAERYK
jgi:glycine betaine/proline transport system ATP-binding protein